MEPRVVLAVCGFFALISDTSAGKGTYVTLAPPIKAKLSRLIRRASNISKTALNHLEMYYRCFWWFCTHIVQPPTPSAIVCRRARRHSILIAFAAWDMPPIAALSCLAYLLYDARSISALMAISPSHYKLTHSALAIEKYVLRPYLN